MRLMTPDLVHINTLFEYVLLIPLWCFLLLLLIYFQYTKKSSMNILCNFCVSEKKASSVILEQRDFGSNDDSLDFYVNC